MKKKEVSIIYLSLFVISFLTLIVMRFQLNINSEHLLLLTWPATFCFLSWSFKKNTMKQKVTMACITSIISLLLWCDLKSFNIFSIYPFLSGGIALLVSFIIDKIYKNQ